MGGLLLAALLVVSSGACHAAPLPSGPLPTPLDPFLRHPFEDGNTSLSGTLELRATCIGMQREGADWALLLWPEGARTIARGPVPAISVEEMVLRVGEPAAVDGFWAVGGTVAWDYLDDRGIRDRCPAKDVFLLTEIARP